MQAILMELGPRDEHGSGVARLVQLWRGCWKGIGWAGQGELGAAAVSHSMKARSSAGRPNFDEGRLDTPWQIAFRRAYEELANRPGERRIG
jgi:hypothetical protein